MNARKSFLWGCIGGAGPEILRWFKLASSGLQFPHLNWFLYGLFLVLYVVLAGAVSVAFKPDNEWKSLWVGASLPAIFAVLVQSVAKLPPGP